MNARPFLLVGITDGSPQSQHLPTLATLFNEGLDFLYWRHSSPISGLKALSLQAQASILLPTLADVPFPFRSHIKEADRHKLPLSSIQAFSTSVHDLNEWPLLAGRVALVFYSPLFPSISKPGYEPTQSLAVIQQQVTAIRQAHTSLPGLIGLGGVQARTIRQVQQAGFDGAAVMGALWQTPDPIEAFRQIKESVMG